MVNIRQLFFLNLLSLTLISQGQSFNRTIEESVLELPNESISGYSTEFDFAAEDVVYGWWKYAKTFSLPQNQRTHYEVTIPATSSAREVVIYTQPADESVHPTTFRLAIKSAEMTEEERERFMEQAKFLLLDFKRDYYLRYFEGQLDELEKSISRTGESDWEAWMEFIAKRNAILDRMKEI